jgi:thiol-disulfide isomerase/thioredoxin
MRIRLWLVLIVLQLSLGIQPAAAGDDVFARFVPETATIAHDTRLTGPGGLRTFGELRGRLVLVHFWAMWCAPCVEELPTLDQLQRRAGEDFAVIAISADRASPERLATFVGELGIEHLGIYQDSFGGLASLFRIRSFPTSFLLGRDGQVIGRLEHTADWNSLEAAAFLERWQGASFGAP